MLRSRRTESTSAASSTLRAGDALPTRSSVLGLGLEVCALGLGSVGALLDGGTAGLPQEPRREAVYGDAEDVLGLGLGLGLRLELGLGLVSGDSEGELRPGEISISGGASSKGRASSKRRRRRRPFWRVRCGGDAEFISSPLKVPSAAG